MKKVLALILATLMLVSLFVGCAKQDSLYHQGCRPHG